MLLFSTRLWACGYCGLLLDELVGLSVYRAAVTRVLYMRRNLFSTSLWACRYIVRRLLGYYMCGGTYSRRACGLVGISCGGYSGIICAAELTNCTLFFSVKLNFQQEKMPVSSRIGDYWIDDDAVQQCFSVLVRLYDVLKTRKKL